jgi:hypothetical protein
MTDETQSEHDQLLALEARLSDLELTIARHDADQAQAQVDRLEAQATDQTPPRITPRVRGAGQFTIRVADAETIVGGTR